VSHTAEDADDKLHSTAAASGSLALVCMPFTFIQDDLLSTDNSSKQPKIEATGTVALSDRPTGAGPAAGPEAAQQALECPVYGVFQGP
jgi:hypothetical protein